MGAIVQSAEICCWDYIPHLPCPWKVDFAPMVPHLASASSLGDLGHLEGVYLGALWGEHGLKVARSARAPPKPILYDTPGIMDVWQLVLMLLQHWGCGFFFLELHPFPPLFTRFLLISTTCTYHRLSLNFSVPMLVSLSTLGVSIFTFAASRLGVSICLKHGMGAHMTGRHSASGRGVPALEQVDAIRDVPKKSMC